MRSGGPASEKKYRTLSPGGSIYSTGHWSAVSGQIKGVDMAILTKRPGICKKHLESGAKSGIFSISDRIAGVYALQPLFLILNKIK
jgi:hypothetical protein